MAASDLTAQRLREVFNYDSETGVFTHLAGNHKSKPGSVAGTTNNAGYLVIYIDAHLYLAHRLAWLFAYGEWPEHLIDHINMDRLDNRLANLRNASKSLNAQNQRDANSRNKESGLMGVSRNHGRWKARLQLDGKQVFLGSFDTPEEAHQAYVAAKRVMHPGCTM